MAADTTGELWHKRLCHMRDKRMRKLAVDDLIPEVKNLQLDKCANCLVGKQNRTSFRLRPPMRRKAQVELVHTNVCSVDTKSHSGGQYFVTFIDEHSHKLWAYVIKKKDQVYECLQGAPRESRVPNVVRKGGYRIIPLD